MRGATTHVVVVVGPPFRALLLRCALLILLARSSLRYLLPSLARPGLSTEQAAAQPRNHLLVEYLSTGTYYNDHRCVGYCCCCFLSVLLLLLLL